jgi:excisionase family DNA binding protein
MDKLYTLKEAAELLNVSTKTVTRYIKQGNLKASKLGSQWRIKPSEVERFVDKSEG